MFILGGDIDLSDRENSIIEGKKWLSNTTIALFTKPIQPFFTSFEGMLTSETYLGMFRELVDLHSGNGPYNWTFSNVPIWVEHNIQLAENVSQEEDRYSREYVPELGMTDNGI